MANQHTNQHVAVIGAGLHIRHGGDISRQQLGTVMLEYLAEAGCVCCNGAVTGITGERPFRVEVGDEPPLRVDQIVNAAGPFARGGFQAIPAGQFESGKALGLGKLKILWLIVLPQVFRHALPATINMVVITFKETAVVIIIGFFDLLASASAAFGTGE